MINNMRSKKGKKNLFFGSQYFFSSDDSNNYDLVTIVCRNITLILQVILKWSIFVG